MPEIQDGKGKEKGKREPRQNFQSQKEMDKVIPNLFYKWTVFDCFVVSHPSHELVLARPKEKGRFPAISRQLKHTLQLQQHVPVAGSSRSYSLIHCAQRHYHNFAMCRL